MVRRNAHAGVLLLSEWMHENEEHSDYHGHADKYARAWRELIQRRERGDHYNSRKSQAVREAGARASQMQRAQRGRVRVEKVDNK